MEKLKIPKIERIGLKKSQIKDVDETENIRRRKKEKDYQAYRNNLNKLLQQLEKDNIEKEIQVDIQFILQNDVTAQAENLKVNPCKSVLDFVQEEITRRTVAEESSPTETASEDEIKTLATNLTLKSKHNISGVPM